jgi:hypothetical protein
VRADRRSACRCSPSRETGIVFHLQKRAAKARVYDRFRKFTPGTTFAIAPDE